MEFDAITGNRLDVVTFDVNQDNKLSAFLTQGDASGDYLQFSVIRVTWATTLPARKSTGFCRDQTTVGKQGGIEDRIISTSDGKLVQIGAGRGTARDGRAMWREVR